MRIINKKYLLIILLVGIILTGVIIYKPKENVKLDNVILKQEVNSKTFAMYKEEGKSYVPVEGTKFPEAYVLNLNESRCIDNNGNEIKDALSYENDKVVLKSNKSSYCYLYFDKSLGLEIKDKNPNGLNICEYDAETKYEQCGDMHRFQGDAKDENGNELVDNYICFGTSDKDKCVSDTDHYMYRIIGIEAETGRVKVIKKEALEHAYQWWNDYESDIDFPNSKIYETINGAGFLENTDYVPAGWEEKISNNTWMYGDMMGGSSMGGLQNGLEIYKVETGQKETKYKYKKILDDGTITDAEIIAFWNKKENFKIGLMYVCDYYLAVNNEAVCLRGNDNDICKDSWINLSTNSQDNYEEYLMTRVGYSEHYFAYFASAEGYVGDSTVTLPKKIRPVFYINASEELLSGTSGGTGTITDPFMIKE